MNVSAIWVCRHSDTVLLRFESDGRWFEAAQECAEGPFSHIVELDVTGENGRKDEARSLCEFKLVEFV